MDRLPLRRRQPAAPGRPAQLRRARRPAGQRRSVGDRAGPRRPRLDGHQRRPVLPGPAALAPRRVGLGPAAGLLQDAAAGPPRRAVGAGRTGRIRAAARRAALSQSGAGTRHRRRARTPRRPHLVLGHQDRPAAAAVRAKPLPRRAAAARRPRPGQQSGVRPRRRAVDRPPAGIGTDRPRRHPAHRPPPGAERQPRPRLAARPRRQRLGLHRQRHRPLPRQARGSRGAALRRRHQHHQHLAGRRGRRGLGRPFPPAGAGRRPGRPRAVGAFAKDDPQDAHQRVPRPPAPAMGRRVLRPMPSGGRAHAPGGLAAGRLGGPGQQHGRRRRRRTVARAGRAGAIPAAARPLAKARRARRPCRHRAARHARR